MNITAGKMEENVYIKNVLCESERKKKLNKTGNIYSSDQMTCLRIDSYSYK